MSHICHVKIRKILYEYPDICPFSMFGVRELSRASGLDASYLSRVKNGKLAISESNYEKLFKASLSLVPQEDSNNVTNNNEEEA